MYFADFDGEWDDIEIDNINVQTDMAELCSWFSIAAEAIEEIKDKIEAHRLAGFDNEDWLHRASMKIVYMKKGRRRLEQRILALGGVPPYPLGDPRRREILRLTEELRKAKAQLARVEA
jgi:hypothetical protein